MADEEIMDEILTEAQIDAVRGKVVKACTDASRAAFNDMKKLTNHRDLAVRGLQAYIYGFLAPIYGDLYKNNISDDVIDGVTALVSQVARLLAEETREIKRKRAHCLRWGSHDDDSGSYHLDA